MDTTIPFGRHVHELRKAWDLTQEALAEQVGCSVVTLKKIEQGRLRPSRQLAELLAAALGVAPAEQVAFVRRARQTAPSAPSHSHPAPRTNLPLPTTTLLGREPEVAALAALLCGGTRLVTLTGPPGIGKSRLALDTAHTLRPDFPAGVWWVPLAAARDPERVLPSIGRVLGLQERGSQPPLETLQHYLCERQLLLVLDNFEQVVAAGPMVSDLLRRCAHLRVLVTSRAPLHLSGEHVVPVPPLALPDLAHLPEGDTLAQYAAVALLLERAEEAGAHLELDAPNARAVAELCCRLEGIPLALELAATRLLALPPAALLARLGHALPVLTGGARDVPPHQQTLRATIAWSYDLLGAGEQQLFRRLAVFRGGCALDAIGAICNRAGDLGVDVLDGITALVDQSLVFAEPRAGGEPRYIMLELIHEYAEEQLEASGEADPLRREHAHYFMTLAETAEPYLKGAQQIEWLVRLEHAHENIQAALEWAAQGSVGAEPERLEIGLRLALACALFWEIHGHYSEGRHWLAALVQRVEESALAGGAGLTDPFRRAYIRALIAAGQLAWWQGETAAARPLLEHSLTLAREEGDKVLLADALHTLAKLAREEGNYDLERALIEESLALRRGLGDKLGMASSLMNLSVCAWERGDYEAQRVLLEESLALCRELGNQHGVAVVTRDQGIAAWRQGAYETAKGLFLEALTISRELGDRHSMAYNLAGLGIVAYNQQALPEARRLLEESLMLAQEIGARALAVNALDGLAFVANDEGNYTQAIALHQQALAIWPEAARHTRHGGMSSSLDGLAIVAYTRGEYQAALPLLQEALTIRSTARDFIGIVGSVMVLAAVLARQVAPAAAQTDGAASSASAPDEQRRVMQAVAQLLGGAAAVLPPGAILEWPAERAACQRATELARQWLGDEAFVQVWQDGHALSQEQVVAFALELAERGVARMPTGERPRGSPLPGGNPRPA